MINLRMAGEQNQPLSPEAEGDAVRAAGLGYAHNPVSPAGPQPAQVDTFRKTVADAAGPVLVHCASGKRASTITILQVASEEGLSGEEAIAKAQALGFNWNSAELEDLVLHYLDGRC